MRNSASIISISLFSAATFFAAASQSNAAPRCNPKMSGARILNSPDINDVHSDWIPPNAVGTGWSLDTLTHHGPFLSGTLYSSRGTPQPGRIYVIANEWDCE